MEDVLVALRRIPFGRILLAFATGILLQYHCGFSAMLLVILAIILTGFLAGYLFLPVSRRFAVRWVQGILIITLLVVAGCAGVQLHQVQQQRQWYGHSGNGSRSLVVTVEEQPVEKTASWKAMVSVQAVGDSSGWKTAKGNLLIYFKKDTKTAAPAYGSQLVVYNKKLQPITGYGNPGAFDYAAYSARQQLFHQVYLLPGDYVVLNATHGSWLTRQLNQCRHFLLTTIHRYLPDKQAAGLAAALLMGYRADIDRELLNAYVQTGIVHIIAISGMHLAMIYGLLYLLLSKLGNGRYGRVLRAVIILGVLWLFTLLAGGAPSILRSAVMFSLIITGETFYKRHNACNNLAASAFLLLVINPFYLWDIGFQLSYAAVFGVVLFYKHIYGIVTWQNRLLNHLWQLMAVTLAAQVFTLPVLLFHFHQFPVFFLLANLVAVPLSGLILYLGMLVLVFCWWPFVAALAGRCAVGLITIMNAFVKHIQQLPAALIQEVSFNVWQAILLSGCICCCGWAWWQKRREAWFMAGMLLVALLATGHVLQWQHQQQKKLIVYNIPSTTAIEFIHGITGYFAGDTAVLRNTAQYAQHIQPAHTLWQVRHCNRVAGVNGFCVFSYAHKKIAFVNQLPAQLVADTSGAITGVDILILAKEAGQLAGPLAQLFQCRQVVFDSSNPVWKIEKWKKACDSLHLRFHSVPRDGAFVMEL